MKCKTCKDKIILYLYGELSGNERKEVESHIQGCASCSRDFAYTKKVFQALDSHQPLLPEADWEKCWKEIDSGIQESPRRAKSFPAFPRWAYAAASLLAVFALGILIGRLWFFPVQRPSGQPAFSRNALQLSLQEHFEDLKPVLVEYANYTSSEGEEETILMDKSIVRSLLLQNILLKRMIAKSDPSLLPFLEDLDLVLREIANQKKGDSRTPSLIKDLIHQRDILFRMEILKKT